MFSDLIEESACPDATNLYYFPDKDDFTKYKSCYTNGALFDNTCTEGTVFVPREDFLSTTCVPSADGQCAVNTTRPEGRNIDIQKAVNA